MRPISFIVRGQAQNIFDCALGNEQAGFPIIYQHGDPTPLEVERNFVDFLPATSIYFVPVLKNGVIQGETKVFDRTHYGQDLIFCNIRKIWDSLETEEQVAFLRLRDVWPVESRYFDKTLEPIPGQLRFSHCPSLPGPIPVALFPELHDRE
jgi:hypothetical protein